MPRPDDPQPRQDPDPRPDDVPTVVDPQESERVDFGFEVLERLESRDRAHRRYTVRGEVARGGMGSILRVWDEDLRRHLAMKVIASTEGSGSSSATASRSLGRFLEEAQVTGQLDHPGIVPVHELGLDADGQVYFTMKLVHGRTLREVFELARTGGEGWNRTRVVGVLLKICEAMAYAHQKGVIHRDLKPANVMVGRFGEVYVMDWGLARVLDREDEKDVRIRLPEGTVWQTALKADVRRGSSDADSPLVTMDGDIVGTPAYMSPEQARGDLAHVDGRTDVYAVGAILYHLLVGHMPYVKENARLNHYAVWARLQEGPPAAVSDEAPDAPPELVAICEKAMERDADRRYATMAALAEDLRAWLEGRVVQAYETGAAAEFRKWVKRNRALAATVLGALLVAFAAIGGAALRLADKNRDLERANRLALESEQRAQEKAAIAERRGAELAEAQERFLRVSGMADRTVLADLVDEAAELWPALPETVEPMRAWIARAEEFRGKLAVHRENLAALRESATRTESADPLLASDELAAPIEASAQVRYEFDSPEDQWQHDNLAGLVEEIERFLDPESGELAAVRRRLELASTIEERSVSGPEAQWAWAEAIESIADPASAPAYGGLELAPQIGLLPIGRDPLTGLWEFAHLSSGKPATRDPENGELVLEEDTGIVLVLIPPGTAVVGAQRTEPEAPHYDPWASDEEGPVSSVELDAYFLSKYEMTQGQWLGFTGENPALYDPSDPSVDSLLHPIENVSWLDCRRVLRHMGLELPTEAQWEYGARAGTDTPWWTGSEPESLAGAANLADRSFQASGAPPDMPIEAWLDDGFPIHTEVGRLRANPFGLHDVHGNVWEWCLDPYDYYRNPMRPGDGLRQPKEWKSYPNRGGSWGGPAGFARSARRYNVVPGTLSNDLGVRPSRSIE